MEGWIDHFSNKYIVCGKLVENGQAQIRMEDVDTFLRTSICMILLFNLTGYGSEPRALGERY